jgi:rubrerythrin
MCKIKDALEIEQREKNYDIDSDYEDKCEVCGGEGWVREDASDGEGHIMRGAGDDVRCPECNSKEQDPDDARDNRDL